MRREREGWPQGGQQGTTRFLESARCGGSAFTPKARIVLAGTSGTHTHPSLENTAAPRNVGSGALKWNAQKLSNTGTAGVPNRLVGYNTVRICEKFCILQEKNKK